MAVPLWGGVPQELFARVAEAREAGKQVTLRVGFIEIHKVRGGDQRFPGTGHFLGRGWEDASLYPTRGMALNVALDVGYLGVRWYLFLSLDQV